MRIATDTVPPRILGTRRAAPPSEARRRVGLAIEDGDVVAAADDRHSGPVGMAVEDTAVNGAAGSTKQATAAHYDAGIGPLRTDDGL